MTLLLAAPPSFRHWRAVRSRAGGLVLLASGIAWVALGAATVRDWYGTDESPPHLHAHSATVHPWTLGWVTMWLLMVLAMMWPLVVPTLNLVARASYPRWRARLTLTTLATSSLLWLAFGLGTASVAQVVAVPAGSAWWQLAFLGVAIAAWRSARRTRLLWKCAKLPPVAPGGRRGVIGAARAGVVSWQRCGLLCGPVMAAMSIGHDPVVMVLASLSVWWEARHPRAWRDKVPLLLLGGAALWVAGSLVMGEAVR